MRRLLVRAFLLVLALSTSVAGPCLAAETSILQAAGRIERVENADENEVRLRRENGRVEPARAYAYLRVGDELVITGSAARVLVLLEAGGRRRLSSADSPFLITGRPHAVSALAIDFINGWETLLASRQAPIPSLTAARGVTERQVEPDGFLGSGQQYAPSADPTVVAVWRCAGAEPRTEGADVETVNPDEGWARVRIRRSPARVRLIGTEPASTIGFQITLTDAVPRPPWSAAEPASENERVAAAFWLLAERPTWRLYAASLLARLSDKSLAAQTIWRSLLNGSLGEKAGAPPNC